MTYVSLQSGKTEIRDTVIHTACIVKVYQTLLLRTLLSSGARYTSRGERCDLLRKRYTRGRERYHGVRQVGHHETTSGS